MIQFEWKDLMWIVGVGAAVGGLLFVLMRVRLSETFATRADMAALAKRLDVTEARLASVPDHDDIAKLSDRLGGVERSVAVAAQHIAGTNTLLSRVEHQVSLMVQHQIERSSA